MTEIIGYAASAFIMASFLVKNITKLRIINSFGCLCFIIYAMNLQPISYPVIIPNVFILCVNIYYLFVKGNIDTVT